MPALVPSISGRQRRGGYKSCRSVGNSQRPLQTPVTAACLPVLGTELKRGSSCRAQLILSAPTVSAQRLQMTPVLAASSVVNVRLG